MTGHGAQIAGSTAAQDAARDWEALRGAGDIQFAPLPPMQPPQTPDWLKTLGEWLRWLLEPVGKAFGMSWPVLEKVAIALAILLVLFLAWRLLKPVLAKLRAEKVAEEPEWMPDRAAAAALLEDADRLAAQGRYAEATHLLLQRSVSHIAEARPEWLMPASTAREIAEFPMLPEAARKAFRTIADRVERSLFALHDLDAGDWQTARAAYADFALSNLAPDLAA